MKDLRLCIDVSDFDIEKKKRVHTALVKLGLHPLSDIGVLCKAIRLTSLDRCGNFYEAVLYGCRDDASEAQKPYLKTYDELMEMAGIKHYLDGKESLYSSGKVSLNVGDSLVVTGFHEDGKSLLVDIEHTKPIDIRTDKEKTVVEVTSKESGKRYWDGKEPLENGMFVRVNKKELEFIGKNSNGSYVCLVEGTFDDYKAFHFENLKPIDTRTNKEKCQDDFSDWLDDDNTKPRTEFVDAVKSGKFHNVKWVGKDE